MSDEHFELGFKNPCLNYHPPECGDETVIWLPSRRPKFLWVVCKTVIKLKNFKARGVKKCVVLFYQMMWDFLHRSRSIHSTVTSLTWGDITLGTFGIAWRHFWVIGWKRPRMLLSTLQGHRSAPMTKNGSKMSTVAEDELKGPRTIHHVGGGFSPLTACCQQVSPQALFYLQLCPRESINPCNIWNEIPTAKLLWKAVTCWWAEAYVTKIDQLHKLSRALKEFILLVWTSVAVLSKSKTQMVPRVAKLGKEI